MYLLLKMVVFQPAILVYQRILLEIMGSQNYLYQSFRLPNKKRLKPLLLVGYISYADDGRSIWPYGHRFRSGWTTSWMRSCHKGILKPYPPGNESISHLGKSGKSSTQNAIFGWYVSSLEDICLVVFSNPIWKISVSLNLDHILQIELKLKIMFETTTYLPRNHI